MLNINYKFEYREKTPTIVFLHGWGLSGGFFDGIASKLKSNVSILTVDLPGFGKSQEPHDYFDTYEYAYQIFLLLKSLKIDKIILIGHSFGGRLAILLSSVYKINVLELILTSSAGINKFNLITYLKIRIYKLIKRNIFNKKFKNKLMTKFASKDYMNAEGNLRGVFVRVVNQDLSVFAKRLDDIHATLVWDKNDKETKYWICKRLNKYISNSQVILYNNGGHFVAFKNQYKFASLVDGIVDKLL